MAETVGQRVAAYSLLPVRLAVAAVFIYAGWKKFIDLDTAISGFTKSGILFPSVTTPLVATAELFGGLGIALGVLPRFSAAVLAIVMLQATWTVYSAGRPFLPSIGFNIVLGACMLAIVLAGPGKATVGQIFHRPWMDIESVVGRRLRPHA